MTKSTFNFAAWDAGFRQRLTANVSRKLDAPVTFLRFDKDPRTNADIPVFAVPAAVYDKAVALGLRAEAR